MVSGSDVAAPEREHIGNVQLDPGRVAHYEAKLFERWPREHYEAQIKELARWLTWRPSGWEHHAGAMIRWDLTDDHDAIEWLLAIVGEGEEQDTDSLLDECERRGWPVRIESPYGGQGTNRPHWYVEIGPYTVSVARRGDSLRGTLADVFAAALARPQ